MNQINTKKWLCAPEFTQSLFRYFEDNKKMNSPVPKEDKNYLLSVESKTDLYFLGLTLLEIATYKSSSELYDPFTQSLDFLEIKNRIIVVENVYNNNNEWLGTLIRKLL